MTMNKFKKFLRHHKEIKAWDTDGEFIGHWMKFGAGWVTLVRRIEVVE
jgi:hypothetical protein